MSDGSKIEWTHNTFNIAWGCIEASPGCDHCYARALAHRYGHNVWGKGVDRRVMSDTYWAQPLKWNKRAAAAGVRERVFCSSMTDVFLNDPIIDRERDRLWTLIAQTPNLDWQILTKHPERFKWQLPLWQHFPNVWLGVSVENMDFAYRADLLRDADWSATKFLSLEPLLGPIERDVIDGMDWVIVGGESGPGARPMDIAWARDIRDYCRHRGAAFFMKQLGTQLASESRKGGHIEEIPVDLRIREFPRVAP